MKISDLMYESYLGPNKNKIYQLLLDAHNCGPFDGGCVIFARALQIKFGSGQIEVLINDAGPQHAVLHDGDRFYDADGAAERKEFIKRFEKNEGVKITGVKSMHPSYLPDAPRDEKMSQQIADLL